MKYLLTIIILITTPSTNAEVITDGTLGQQINLPGLNFQITSDLGQQHGGNLFHSFQDFNLNSSETATFSGSNSINNIISRVTGGNPSNIDGLIRSTIPNADFYFLNPYGIMFGSNAKLDVQGSFHASTADYLRLGNEGRFDAKNLNQSLLTVAPITAFGFLTDSASAIDIQDSTLSISNGKTLSLIGGDLTIDKAKLSAPYGQINLTTMQDIENTSVLQGSITISGNSLIDVSGEGGGSIFIRSGQFTVDNSTIAANTLGNQDGQQINIQANNVTLLNRAKITGDTLGQGKGTDIWVNAVEQIMINEIPSETSDSSEASNPSSNDKPLNQQKTVQNYSGFLARSGINDSYKGKTLGDAGRINLQANNIKFGPVSIASSSTYSKGNSGNIHIKTNDLQMQSIFNQEAKITTSTFSQGRGGKITILADIINLKGGVNIESVASGHGNAGLIELQTQSLRMISNKNNDTARIRTATVSYGNAGNILIYADKMELNDGATINSETIATGNGGDIQLKVTGKLLISGQSSNVPKLNTRISANANGRPNIKDFILGEPVKLTGHGGTITIEAGELELREGGQIQSISQDISHSAGPAGNIIVRVQGTLLIHGFIQEDSTTQFSFNSGIYSNSIADKKQASSAGDITLEAEQLIIQNGGMVSSDTNNSSTGGNLDIHVSKLDIDGKVAKSDLQISGLYASSSSPKPNAGTAGSITIEADNIYLKNDGKFTTAAQNAGGGNITLNNGGTLYLHNGTINTSVRGGSGDGGNIKVNNPQFVVLNKGRIVARADAGHGGNIDIKSEQFITSQDSLISASSRLGIDGEINIDSPDMDMEGFLVVLSDDVVEASSLMKRPCSMRGSSFVVNKINGSSQTPYDYQPARYLPNTENKVTIVSKKADEKLAVPACNKF